MAPKAKGKATVKPKAKGKVGSASSMPLPGSVVADVEPKSRRQLNRRDSNDTYVRATEGKLDHIDAAMLVSKMLPCGKSAKQYLKDAIAENKSGNKRLCPAFWIGFYALFGLTESVLEQIPDPDEAEEIDPGVWDALKTARSDHTLVRGVRPFERYMEKVAGVNYRTWAGIATLTLEGPKLCKHNAMTLQFAALSAFARTLVPTHVRSR
jgi:hypothetical protein